MYKKLSFALTKKLVEVQAVKDEDFDIYSYGFELIISLFSTVFLIILISLAADTFFETVLFLAGFFAVRIIGGGYHANRHSTCFITTISMYLGFLALLYLANGLSCLRWILLIASVFSGILIFAFSPAEHPDNPMTEYRKKRNRTLSIIFSAVFVSASIAVFFFEKVSATAMPFATGVFFAALTILTAKIQNKIKERRS